MSKSFTLPKRDDNSTEDAEKLVKWAHTFEDVEAHIVMDYIPMGSAEFGNQQMVPGALNGVTLQWGIYVDVNPDDDVPPVRVAEKAVHAPAGSTIVRTPDGFEVTFTMVREVVTPEGEDNIVVTSAVTRTIEGDDVRVVSA